MARRRSSTTTTATRRNPTKAIIATLTRAAAPTGWRRSQIFSDWLEIIEATLEQLPAHAAHVRTHGHLLAPNEESEEVQALWRKMQLRYDHHWPTVAREFHAAFQCLVDAAATRWNDWLGEIFMEWELGSEWHGQYFTPWEVAAMMAQMMNITASCHQRVKDALLHPENAVGQALLLGALTIEDADAAHTYFMNQLLPAALPFVEPVLVNEPAVGSGVMLLALASTAPDWANRYGIIRYTGQDTDILCVRMAKIQMMLYGLNGYAVRCQAAAFGAGQRAVPVEDEETAAAPPALRRAA